MRMTVVMPGVFAFAGIKDSSARVVNTPNNINDAMFPISVVPMNQVGLRLKKATTRAANVVPRVCDKIFVLFADKNATSTPEKRTDNSRELIRRARYALSLLRCQPA